jgi:molecular chaperone GrpE
VQIDALKAEHERLRAQVARLRSGSVAAAPPLGPKPAEHPRVAELSADLHNLRRHRDEAIARASSEGRATGITALGGVRDDVDRALMALGTDNNDDDDPWLVGLRSLRASVDAGLRRLGAVVVGQVGELFDPALHEAVGQIRGDVDGRIAAVEQLGFVANDRLVRPARVVVTYTPT